MTADARILGYLGLAARGRRIVSGEFSTEKAVKSGQAALVVLAGDASDNTKKDTENMCSFYEVPLLVFSDRGTIGHAIGRGDRVSAAVTDEKLAAAILRVREEEKS